MDQHVPSPLAAALRRRGVDVLTAQEDGTSEADDEIILARATAMGRLVVSADADYLAITHRWLDEGRPFAGIARIRQRDLDLGRTIEDLELIAQTLNADEAQNRIF
jgi:predicted nuclease of predicted toxin-antitoxin system